MKYTADDVERIYQESLRKAGKAYELPKETKPKYTAEDVERIYQESLKPKVRLPHMANNRPVSLGEIPIQQPSKAESFLNTVGYSAVGQASDTADALTYIKQYKMAENADKLHQQIENKQNRNIAVTPRQRMYAKAAQQIDKDSLVNQTDTTKNLLSKAAENEQILKEGNGAVANTLIDIGLAGTDMLAKAGISKLTHIPLPVLFGVTSGAQRFQEDINQGKDIDLALKSGVGSGIITGGVESISGIGASKLSKALGGKAGTKLLSKMPENISKYLAKASDSVIGKVLKDAIGEGLEEAIEYDAQRVYRNLLMNEETPRDIKEQAYNMLIGAGVGGIFGGAQAVGSAFLNQKSTQPTDSTIEQISNVKTQNNGSTNQQVMTAEGIIEAESTIPETAPVGKQINTKSKVERYQSRQENQFINNIADALGISKFADKTSLKESVNALTEELKNGTVSQEKVDNLFNKILDEGIQVDFTYYNQYSDLKNSIKKARLYVSDQVKNEIGEYNNFRKSNLGNLSLTNDKGATQIDSYYQELSETNPELFPANIVNPTEQLRQISEVQNSIVATENNLNLFIDDYSEFKQWARNDFDKAVSKLAKEAKQVKKVQDEKQAKKDALEKELSDAKVQTVENLKQVYSLRNQYQKQYERANGMQILTERERNFVDQLVKGHMTVEELPNGVNKGGIINVYKAKATVYAIDKTIKDYNKSQKQFLRDMANELTQNSMSWNEKLSGFQYQRETMERNIRDIVPDKKEAKAIIDAFFTPVHTNEAKSTKMKNELRDRVRKLNLSDKKVYVIPAFVGNPEISRVSERGLVQLLGEKKVTKEFLQNIGADVGKIENSVNEFRSIYNYLINQANDVLIENGYAPVDYRADYFPHFEEDSTDNLLGKIGRLIGFDVNTKELPTDIAGITHIFKPGKKWFGNFLQRTSDSTVYDAVEGFDRYIEGISDVIHHTEDIQRLRALEDSIRYNYSSDGIKAEIDKIIENDNMDEIDKKNRIEELYEIDKNKFPYLVTELRKYTNILAGKKVDEDRNMEHRLGRGMYEISKAMENRVAANMVAINPGSWITNFIPIAQGLGGVKSANMFNGMKDTIKSYGDADGFIGKSTFLTNRRGSEPLAMTKVQRLSATLSSPMQIIDNFTSESLVRARYYENMNKGMTETEAMKDADRWAAGVMADRSKGALPTFFNERNPLAKTVTMFQLEVNNQLSYLFKDIPDDLKKKGALAIVVAFTKIFVASWLYNELYEKITGRRAAFDPIDIVLSAVGDFTDDEKSTYTAVANTSKNIAEEIPFFGGLIGGGRLPISSALPDVPNVFKAGIGLTTGEMNEQKALSVLGKELVKPLSYGVPFGLPFGGGQIKKAAEGISTVYQGGSFGVDSQGRDTLQFSAERTPINYAQAAVFGKYALPAAKDYVDSGFKSLTGPYTEKYKDALNNGFTSEEFLRTYEAYRKAKSSIGKDGKVIPLSKSKNQKEAIDKANPGMSAKELEQLYKYFELSEKVWKPKEGKMVNEMKNALPTIKGVTFNTKLPTIKE